MSRTESIMRSPRLAIWCYRPPRLDEQLLLWVRQDDIHMFQQVLRELIESGSIDRSYCRKHHGDQ